MTRAFHVHDLGRREYGEVHALQHAIQQARVRGEVPDTVLVVEHDPVITMGRAAKAANVLLSPERLTAMGFGFHETGRGGDVTYHGPGQLVLYPIVDLSPDLQDVRKYVWTLEETMIRTCATYGLSATRIAGLNGAWVADRKVGAVGVRLSRWVTMHGLALNVTTDLSHFRAIVPCGIQDKAVTSLAKELGKDLTVAEVARVAVGHFAAQYDATIEWLTGAPTVPDAPSTSVST